MSLALMGKTSALEVISSVAKTLHSCFETMTKGNEEAQRELWKIFKKKYKSAGYTGTHRTLRDEAIPVKKED